MRISIRQVAEHANVSPGTVSNVLRGRDARTSPATRESVMRAVRELGYIPVAQPGSQRRHQETRVIGLVFDFIDVEDEWGSPAFRGIRERCGLYGYDVLTLLRAPADWMLDKKELQFLDRRSDGFIFLAPRNRNDVLQKLVEYEIPAVACFIEDLPQGVGCLVLDDADAMRQAVDHLLASGHRKIAFAGPSERSDFVRRRVGYEEAMHRAGLEDLWLFTEEVGEGGMEASAQLVLKGVLDHHITAVVFASDLRALAFMRVARQAGLRIPEDISVTGMDNIPEAATNGLTTIGFSSQEMGRRAVDMLVAMIRQEEPESKQVLPVHLIERSSVAPL